MAANTTSVARCSCGALTPHRLCRPRRYRVTISPMNLHLDETIRRNLRKTPEERVETLMAALREVEARGQWPKTDRKAKEQRILRSLRDKPRSG